MSRPGTADRALARHAFRQVSVGATVWALVFGATAAASALSYVDSFPTAASRHQIAATTGKDAGLAILFGPISAVDTVGGYTVYKGFVFLTTIGAIWALLAATRLLRGEEDAGRWQLLLTGVTSASRATAATLAGLAAAVTVVFLGTTALVLLAGRNPDLGFGARDTVLYGLSVALVPAVFVAVGALTSQLARTRRLATGLGLGAFGVAFVVRMMGDSGPGVRWLLWLTPFGWSERMRPFSENALLPLLPAAGVVVLLGTAAVLLAGRRDAGDGALAPRDVVPPRPFGLRSPLGLATRLQLPVLIAWCVGSLAAAFSFGIVTKVVTGTLPESLGKALDRFGVRGALVDQFLGVAFLFVATLVALIAAGAIGNTADDETGGRLVHLVASPVPRARLLGGRLALTAVAMACAGVLAGVGACLGAATQGVHLDLGTAVGAGLNVVPTALVVLGLGALAVSITPRAGVPTVYAVVVWSLVGDLLSSMVSALRWVEHLSLFHYMDLAPAAGPDPVTLTLTTAAGLALCAVATVLFARRDLRTG